MLWTNFLNWGHSLKLSSSADAEEPEQKMVQLNLTCTYQDEISISQICIDPAQTLSLVLSQLMQKVGHNEEDVDILRDYDFYLSIINISTMVKLFLGDSLWFLNNSIRCFTFVAVLNLLAKNESPFCSGTNTWENLSKN